MALKHRGRWSAALLSTVRLGRGAALPVALAVAAVTGLSSCGVSPEDAEAGHLTGVVTSRPDSFSLPGGGATDIYERVVVVTADEMLAAYERTWPGKPPPQDFGTATSG